MYPKGPNVTGIRVWHVDSRLMKNFSGSSPTLTSTITSGSRYTHAMSNSTNSASGSLYANYRDYKLLTCYNKAEVILMPTAVSFPRVMFGQLELRFHEFLCLILCQ